MSNLESKYRKLKMARVLPEDLQEILKEVMLYSEDLSNISEGCSEFTKLRIYANSNRDSIEEHMRDFEERDCRELNKKDVFMAFVPGVGKSRGVIYVCPVGLDGVVANKASASFMYCGGYNTIPAARRKVLESQAGNKDACINVEIEFNGDNYASVNVRFWCD